MSCTFEGQNQVFRAIHSQTSCMSLVIFHFMETAGHGTDNFTSSSIVHHTPSRTGHGNHLVPPERRGAFEATSILRLHLQFYTSCQTMQYWGRTSPHTIRIARRGKDGDADLRHHRHSLSGLSVQAFWYTALHIQQRPGEIETHTSVPLVAYQFLSNQNRHAYIVVMVIPHARFHTHTQGGWFGLLVELVPPQRVGIPCFLHHQHHLHTHFLLFAPHFLVWFHVYRFITIFPLPRLAQAMPPPQQAQMHQ